MISKEWFKNNRYKCSSFSNIKKLLRLKEKQDIAISLVIPTFNEASSIRNVITTLKSELMDKLGIVDEIIVVDSGSKDKTRIIARKAGAKVYLDSTILRSRGNHRGKGENLWKSLYVSKGDIICWVDADIKNIHPKFVYGIVGPLLENKRIGYVKPFYARPVQHVEGSEPLGGGRVSEMLIRPLINQYFPVLSAFISPLSGEGAARREVLEQIPIFSGYGLETGMLIDINKKFGLSKIAQVDLDKRLHRHQSLTQLSKMAYAILQVFVKRANTLGKLVLVQEVSNAYKVPERTNGEYHLVDHKIEEKERPPMALISGYRKKFKKDPKWVYD